MNMNTPQIPWNPAHPAMIPLTQETIETGLSCIKALREKFLTPCERQTPKFQIGVTAEFCKRQRGSTERVRAKFTRSDADERAEPRVTADIAALSSLDNQKLGLYQHA